MCEAIQPSLSYNTWHGFSNHHCMTPWILPLLQKWTGTLWQLLLSPQHEINLQACHEHQRLSKNQTMTSFSHSLGPSALCSQKLPSGVTRSAAFFALWMSLFVSPLHCIYFNLPRSVLPLVTKLLLTGHILPMPITHTRMRLIFLLMQPTSLLKPPAIFMTKNKCARLHWYSCLTSVR